MALALLEVGCQNPCGTQCDSDTTPLETGEPTETGETGDTAPPDTDSGSGDDTGDTADPIEPAELALDGDGSIKLTGESPWVVFMSIAGAGDVDADGYDDVLIGMACIPGGEGTAYLVRGPIAADRGLSTADARMTGDTHQATCAGYAVAGAGDVNADGFGDVLVGAPYGPDENNGGYAYLVTGPIAGSTSLADAEATLEGELVDLPHLPDESWTGASLAAAGDVDGDGFDDILVGSPGYDARRGAAYLLRGPVSGPRDLADADVRFLGRANEGHLGNSAGSAGDVDADGSPDVFVSQPGSASASVLFFTGAAALEGDLGEDDADAWYVPSEFGAMGATPAGDVDGDGYDDLWLNTPLADVGADDAGAAFLLRGPFAGPFELDADATVHGVEPDVGIARSLDLAGDVDGDGNADLVLGTWNGGRRGEPGSAWLAFGPFAGTQSVDDIGLRLVGEGDDEAGQWVASAGDVDADGIPDLLIAGPGDDDGGEDAGAAWLVYGATVRGALR